MTKSRVAKCAVVMFVALATGVALRAQVPDRAMGRHGVMGPGSFAFERLIGGFGGKVVTNSPFSAQVTRETVQVLADGTRIDHKETGNIARDSVGRTRDEMTMNAIGPLEASGLAPHIVFIRDPAAAKNYVLNEDKKTVMAMDTSRWGTEERRNSMRKMNTGEDANVQTLSLGTKTMDGLTVTGTRTTRTIPAEQIGNDKPIVITREEWYSSDLQMIVSSTRSDPRFGTTTFQLTNISRNEPSQSMFMVPSDYTASPMHMMRKEKTAPPDAR